MQNAGLDDSQAGVKIAKRNINNLRVLKISRIFAELVKKKALGMMD